MDTLAVVVGGGLAGTLVAYPLMYLALSHRYKASLSNVLNLCLFIAAVPLVGAADLALGSNSTSIKGVLVLLGAPLLVSFIVIGSAFEMLAERAKARAAGGVSGTENFVATHVRGFSKPAERLAFILLVLGVCALLLGLIGFWASRGFYWDQLAFDLRELLFEQINYRRGWTQWSARIGLVAVIVGYLVAYHYERTIGPLLRVVQGFVRWVRTGQ
jgi:hypothetical protein